MITFVCFKLIFLSVAVKVVSAFHNWWNNDDYLWFFSPQKSIFLLFLSAFSTCCVCIHKSLDQHQGGDPFVKSAICVRYD